MRYTFKDCHEGDPNLKEYNYCQQCGKRQQEQEQQERNNYSQQQPSPSLLRCSRCHMVYYCSRKCQKEHFQHHKKACKRILKYQNLVDKEAIPLRSTNPFGDDDDDDDNVEHAENLFETHVGDFWAILETRDYIKALNFLAAEKFNLAYAMETKDAWEACLADYLEVLRLCARDNLGVRHRTSFILLFLNRHDDAFDFCRYWLKELYDDERMEQVHNESKKGDWIYPRNPNCRYWDILEECNGQIPEYDACLSFFLSIFIIKMRMVAAFDIKQEKLQAYTSTKIAQEQLQPVSSVISCFVMGPNNNNNNNIEQQHDLMEKQRAQRDKLLDHIHANNPSMLPSILNPDPMKNQSPPTCYSLGKPSEARMYLVDILRCVNRIPYSKELLESRFGKNPKYDSHIAHFF